MWRSNPTERRRRRAITVVAGVGLVAGLGCGGLQDGVEQLRARVRPAARDAQPVSAAPSADRKAVTALGRIAPRDGVMEIAGPSQPSVVIEELFVEKGQWVEEGSLIALLDTAALHEARIGRLRAQIAHAKSELRRNRELYEERVVSDSSRESRELRVKVLDADLRIAQAELERARVKAPVAGQVMEIRAYPGERVGPDGIVELGRTDEMYVIAEVYETEIARVARGQRAVVTSPTLAEPLDGTVEWIKPKVGKLDILGTDPAAKTDARVVEVEIRLADSDAVSDLTNMQVEVAINP